MLRRLWQSLGQSDVVGQVPPDSYFTLTNQMAHALIGFILATRFVPVWLAVVVFSAWVGKEIFADIPNGGFSNAVMADSATDLAFGLLGYALGRWGMR